MGLKYERQIRLDRGSWQSNCLESRILFLVVHYKELHQMNNWRAKKHCTDTGVYFVSILKLSATEWEWGYNEYDSDGGTFSAKGTIKKYPRISDCVTHVITIPNPVKTFGEDTPDLMFGGMTIHETVMRFVNWQKQEEKATL
jgi:hypothetical protein